MGVISGYNISDVLQEPQFPGKKPIAIIGIGCRFPGEANNPEDFWRLLQNGVDAITAVPADRWHVEALYDPEPGMTGKTYVCWGGFIKGIDRFDADFFGISPREAEHMDPQQRLLLEVTYEALEDAGQTPECIAGSNTGVFIGISNLDYGAIQLSTSERGSIDAYSALGGASSIAAGRISYVFDLKGPNMIIDTACSSSLVAAHLACQSIWSGDCELALLGGVNAILRPELTIGLSKASMLSPDGRCKSFDERADGYVRSEGAGVVVLKPLPDALLDGDRIYAVIRGSGVNQDGRTRGITVPSQLSQEALLRRTYQNADIPPERVQYIEAHGTGTPVGDPIEANALGNVLGRPRPLGQECIIGSVKSNIGHLEAASGIAGLIKTALCLKYGQIPPNLHFQRANPEIPFERLRLRVPQILETWPDTGTSPRLAGLNSFGFSGTNAHIILESAPEPPYVHNRNCIPSYNQALVLPLSARSTEALQALAQSYNAFLTNEGSSSSPSLLDICYSASVRRGHHDHRLALVANSKKELAEKLGAFLAGESRSGISSGRLSHTGADHSSKIVFVFSGMGSQWWGMGRQLLETEPVFREAIEKADALLQQYSNWSLWDEMMADEAHSRIDETRISQPAIFALQVALSAMWRSWGIEPDAIVGHSVGEVAAAHVAGVLNMEDAVRVVFHRSRLQQRLAGDGTMLAVGLSVEEAEAVLRGYEERVCIGAINSPSAVTLSGDADALDEIEVLLTEKQVFCRFLQVEVPYHSHKMEPLKAEFLESLAGIKPQSSTIYMVSSASAQAVEGSELNEAYWWQNMRNPVRFAAAMNQLIEKGYNIFLEISSHPVLGRSIAECFQQTNREGTSLPSLRRKEPERPTMLSSLSRLYTLGYPIDWRLMYPNKGNLVSLPRYPWQHERYWRESELSRLSRLGRREHPLLGVRQESAHPLWSAEIDKQCLVYLNDHRVRGSVAYPEAAYVEMALSAAKEIFEDNSYAVEEMEFQTALFLPDDESPMMQLILNPDQATFHICSRAGNADWVTNATGRLRCVQGSNPPESFELEEIRGRCAAEISKEDFYRQFEDMGLEYGACFRGIERYWRGENEALGLLNNNSIMSIVAVPKPPCYGYEQTGYKPEMKAEEYHIHPAILDSCFQVLIGAVYSQGTDKGDIGGLYLPIGIDSVRFYGHSASELWSYARLVDRGAKYLKGDITLIDNAGNVLAEIQGIHCRLMAHPPETMENYLYKYRWQAESLNTDVSSPEAGFPLSERKRWLIFADHGGVGEALADMLRLQRENLTLISPGKAYRGIDADHFQICPSDPDEMERLIKAAVVDPSECAGIVHLWSLDALAPEETTLSSLESDQALSCLSVLHLVQALVNADLGELPRLWLVTSGAQFVGDSAGSVSIAQSPLWGLGRVIRNEHPSLRCKLVDLSMAASSQEISSLLEELRSENSEDEIAFRGADRYIHRLMQDSLADAQEKSRKENSTEKPQPFSMAIRDPGNLDSLMPVAVARREPGPGEVEIRIHAAALNYRDVLVAMGMLPDEVLEGGYFGQALGLEGAGEIISVGKEVEEFKVGDQVIALGSGAMGTHLTTNAHFVLKKPDHLSLEEAAAIPVVFLTAHYCLNYLGKIREGERVLIHCATGGVGLAAVQLAQRGGVQILATAGSPEKREFLRTLGIRYVMDSRSLEFANEVMEYTNGEGVDIVLNSLAGEAIPKGLSILRPYGRFIDIGNRNIHENSMLRLRNLRNNLSLHAVDIDRLCAQRPDIAGSLLHEIMQGFFEGSLRPLPHRVFPISEIVDALRQLEQAKHTGKIVTSLQDSEILVAPANKQPMTFCANGTYLIVGGLGGFGLATAHWLVKQGARHLVLVGRSGASSDAAKSAVESMKAAGVEVVVAQADVTQAQQVARVIADIRQSMPSLRGIIHTAMVLDDAVLLQLNKERMWKVMASKVIGTWNLHTQTLDIPLDFFVLFSSFSSLTGNPGQGNYAAANAFLDAMAHHRRAQGLPSLTINWGAVADVGHISQNPEIGQRLEQLGVKSLPAQKLLEILGALLQHTETQVGVADMDWQRLAGFQTMAASPKFSPLVEAFLTDNERGIENSIFSSIMAAKPEEQQQILLSYFCGEIARVLGTTPAKVDIEKPLLDLGFDSLMALQIGNRIQSELVVNVPLGRLMGDLSVFGMAEFVIKKLLSEVNQLSNQGLDSLLYETLDRENIKTKAQGILEGDLPLSAPCQSPAAEQLASILRHKREAKSSSSLVAIQPDGYRKPLFCIHACDGEVLIYSRLSIYLGLEQPLYGLRAQGLDKGRLMHHRIEDMAAHYIEEIRAVQSIGPYLLGGMGVGGRIAYEMAQQLVAQNEEVSLLALMDSGPPKLKRLGLPYYLRRLVYSAKHQQLTKALLRKLRKNSFEGFAAQDDQQISDVIGRISARYIPKPYSGRIVYFMAEDRQNHTGKARQGIGTWHELALGELDIRLVPGEHFRILMEPHVQILAQHLRECLESAQANEPRDV